MTLHPDVERWLAYLEQRNRAATTLRTYRSVMAGYLSDPAAASREEVEAWWATQDGAAISTRKRTLSTIRSFYTWAQRFDVVDVDPSRRLDAPSQGRRLPVWTSHAELRAALALAELEEAWDMRRAICLGAYAGLRVAEAAALDWLDVDEEGRRIIVRGGKGDKDRPVGLPPLLLDELLPRTGGNVVTAGGEPYTADALQRRVNRLLARAGVEKTFHKLRARYATMGLTATGNLLAVSRAMGHANVTTTAIYAATLDSDLDVIAEAATR